MSEGVTMAMKRKKKTERQKLILECDNLVREILKIRSKSRSERSGKYYEDCKGLQVCHWIGRSNKRVQWDLDNVFYLGAGEHKFWCHKYPEKFREWVKDKLGEKKFQALIERARATGTYPITELRQKKISLTRKLKRMNKGGTI